MGLFVEFDVVEDFGYLDMTEEYYIVPDYSEGCEVFMETFLKKARKLVPVDTGYLRSTIKVETEDTYCMAEADCEYAQYPEYGTWCQAAQPYFTPALEKALKEAKPYWDRAEEEALKEEEALLEQEEEEEEGEEGGGKSSSRYYRTSSRDSTSSRGLTGAQDSTGFFGGISFASPFAFLGSIMGTALGAFASVGIQAIFGGNFSSSWSSPKSKIAEAGGGKAEVFIPDVIIT